LTEIKTIHHAPPIRPGMLRFAATHQSQQLTAPECTCSLSGAEWLNQKQLKSAAKNSRRLIDRSRRTPKA